MNTCPAAPRVAHLAVTLPASFVPNEPEIADLDSPVFQENIRELKM